MFGKCLPQLDLAQFAGRREIGHAIASLMFVIARSEATKQSILSFRGEMDCFASLAMTVWRRLALMPEPENLPCLRGARNLAAGAARAGRDALDQLPVRGHLGAISQIERILQSGAQVTAQVS